MIDNKKRTTLGIIFSMVLLVAAGAYLFTPRSLAVTAKPENSAMSRTVTANTPGVQSRSTTQTSTNRRVACKRNCVERYNVCLAAKKAKGWSDDRAAKICGLSARTCKGGCNR